MSLFTEFEPQCNLETDIFLFIKTALDGCDGKVLEMQ